MNETLEKVKTPETYLKKALELFKIDGSFTLTRIALLASLIAGALAYHLLVIYGNGNPDAICEGLISYTGADWALACGRWATRYLNGLSFNVIMPGIWVVIYMLTVFAIVVLLAKLWGIHGKISVCMMAVLLAVNPAVIEQSLLQYMFLAWGFSNLLGVLFVYINERSQRKLMKYVAAPCCMAIALGLYQVSLGLICVCVGITMLLELLNGQKIKALLVGGGKTFTFRFDWACNIFRHYEAGADSLWRRRERESAGIFDRCNYIGAGYQHSRGVQGVL